MSRAFAQALPSLKRQYEELGEGLIDAEAREALYSSTFTALKLSVNAYQLKAAPLGDFARAIAHISPVRAAEWFEMKFQSADMKTRSQLIVSVAEYDPERFVKLAVEHFERYQGELSGRCINSLSGPFLRHSRRAALTYIKPLILKLNPAYSPYLIEALSRYGDRNADLFWLEELYEEVKRRRIDQGQIDGGIESQLLATLHSLGHPSALPELIGLALMETRFELEDRLQQRAIKVLEGFKGLDQMIFVNRYEEEEL